MYGLRSPRAPGVGRPSLVLVHGLGCSSCYMIPAARRLAGSFDVFVPDLPGFGLSEKPPKMLTIGEHAGALAEWMTANGISSAILAGNSLGCQVIADLAARFPDRVHGLVLNSPTVDAAHRSVFGELLRLVADSPREQWSLVWISARDYLRAGLFRVLWTLRSALADRIEDKLPRVAAPILIVRGSRDPIVSQPWVEALARVAPTAEVVVVPGAPHAVNYSAADEFSELILAFARKLALAV